MELLFVYNATSGLKQSLFDIGHKLLSPKTYPCSLCALTHDTFKENHVWKSFRENTTAAMVFFHKDEFEKYHPHSKFDYPVILKKDKNELKVILSTKELNTLQTIEDLITALEKRSETTP